MPRMPASISVTPSGRRSRARRATTSTPNPSSPKNTFPMPATRRRRQSEASMLMGLHGGDAPVPFDLRPLREDQGRDHHTHTKRNERLHHSTPRTGSTSSQP